MGFFQSSGILNRKGFFGGKAFSPLDISNLDLWLDAADGNTLYDATSGGSLVTTDGSAVKRWEDKSGNGLHATEATNAPVLETAEKNGLNALNFATSKRLTSSFSSRTYTAQTIFVVAKFSTSASSYGRLFTQRTSGANDYDATQYIPLLRNITNSQVSSWKASNLRSSVSVSNADFYIFRAFHDSSILNVKANTTTGSDYSSTINLAIVNFRIGDMIRADGASDNAFWNSIICEVILYAKSLTDSESDSVTNYLNTKWAVY